MAKHSGKRKHRPSSDKKKGLPKSGTPKTDDGASFSAPPSSQPSEEQ